MGTRYDWYPGMAGILEVQGASHNFLGSIWAPGDGETGRGVWSGLGWAGQGKAGARRYALLALLAS